jgi:hypothetical protein
MSFLIIEAETNEGEFAEFIIQSARRARNMIADYL